MEPIIWIGGGIAVILLIILAVIVDQARARLIESEDSDSGRIEILRSAFSSSHMPLA